jgi:hypothetical protein
MRPTLRCVTRLPHTNQRVRPAPQHQLLQVPDPFEVLSLRRLEDPLPQPPHVVLDRAPIHAIPVEVIAARSVHLFGVQLARA